MKKDIKFLIILLTSLFVLIYGFILAFVLMQFYDTKKFIIVSCIVIAFCIWFFSKIMEEANYV